MLNCTPNVTPKTLAQIIRNQRWIWKTRSWDPGPSHSRSSDENLAVLQQLQQMMKQQQEALQVMAVSIQQGFEMPKRELLTFDGNPLN